MSETENTIRDLLFSHYGENCIFRENSALDSLSPISEHSITLRGKLSQGLCIVRTQGERLDLLAEALASVKVQSIKITTCIVVHASETIFSQIQQWVNENNQDVVVLHANRLDKRRGHPINVALDYLRNHSDIFQFFFFLDDDDILYPFYAERLITTLDLTGADIAFGLANQRVPWLAPEQIHRALPASCLVAGNFIPVHCYVTRTSMLMLSGARAREDMDYLEDWDFLLTLLAAGARFYHIPEIICEYRIISDGNQSARRDPEHYADCSDRVKARARLAAQKLKGDRFFFDLANFDFSERAELTPPEIVHIKEALRIFDSANSDI